MASSANKDDNYLITAVNYVTYACYTTHGNAVVQLDTDKLFHWLRDREMLYRITDALRQINETHERVVTSQEEVKQYARKDIDQADKAVQRAKELQEQKIIQLLNRIREAPYNDKATLSQDNKDTTTDA